MAAPKSPLPNPQDLLRKARTTTSRRAQYSASTQRALIDVARELFTTQGYARTSLDEIVAGARVTKGALYHHFSGKQALFEAVFDRVEDDASKKIRKAMKEAREPWDRANVAIRTFLGVARSSEYRRIVVQEGPAVLGYERYRELEERSTYSIVQEITEQVFPSRLFPTQLLETATRMVFGTIATAGMQVSAAEDPEQEASQVEFLLDFFLSSVRQQIETALALVGEGSDSSTS